MKRRGFLKTAGAGAVFISLPGRLFSAISGLSRSEIERKVKDTLARMSLDDKIEQMSGDVFRDVLQAISPHGVRYTGYTPPNKKLSIPALKCLDGPRGVGLLHKTTCFPVAMCRGSSWEPDLEDRIGSVMGYECRALDANMLLAPCINVLRHPSWGRAQETYGEDPCHLGVMGAAHVEGTQKHVMACPKHYAVNNIDESRMFVNAIIDERTLREIYLPHFKACSDVDAASVMSAYNDVNGELCAHNEHLLRDILKGDWGFQGFVVSDWVNAVEDTVEAANGGLDVEMPRPEYYDWKLKRTVKDGKVQQKHIDEAVTRILRQKFKFEVGSQGYDKKKIASAEHAALAREAARKGMVLLKNKKEALPLDKDVRSVAVIGKMAKMENLGDRGSSWVTPPYAVTPLDGIRNRAGSGVKVSYESGADPEKARKLAAQSDAVIVVAGLTYKDEGEGNDREELGLDPAEIKMIEACARASERCVVVLEGGSAITVSEWKDQVESILMAWYPGMEGGNAIADVLFGDVNPGGKLPAVFPKSKDQLFEFDNEAKEVKVGYYHGYRYFDKKGLEPEFPFGFGLSYTSFEISSLRLDKKTVGKSGKVKATVNVANTGKREGSEVVQAYVGYNGSAVDRPVRDLKAFKKVTLKPGMTQDVGIEIDVADLAYYNPELKQWVVEEIEYTLEVGNCCREKDLLRKSFRVSGV
ncbi:MAG: glycoside hydrolase family 3 C-terminal domain-containing protein [bacterium]